jgi:hypothetical protein
MEQQFSKQGSSAVGSELDVFLAAIRLIRRQPLPEPSHNQPFPFMRKTQYFTILMVVVVLSVIEVPVAHVLINHFLDGTTATVAHVALILLHVYSYFWLAGDYRQLHESYHFFEDDGLHISLGKRFQGVVPYDAMSEMGHLSSNRRHKEMSGLLKVTPFDDSQVYIALNREVTIKFIMGIPRKAQELHFYIDDPDGFLAELEQRTSLETQMA